MKRLIFDVVAVRVGQERRGDEIPIGADALEPSRQRAGTDPKIDQDTRAAGANQGRIPAVLEGVNGLRRQDTIESNTDFPGDLDFARRGIDEAVTPLARTS